MTTDDLVRTLADHVGALATRVERATFQMTRIANASEETNALALTEMRECRTAIEEAKAFAQKVFERLAVLTDNVKDAEGAVREATGAHPLVPFDLDDTDKKIGKAVRWAWNSRPVRWAIGLVGSTTFGAVVSHWLHRIGVLH